MVDFSLTEGDQRFLDLIQEEYELGRKFAREVDREAEHKPPVVKTLHPALEGKPDPYELLHESDEGTSGHIMVDALMHMVSAKDLDMRPEGLGFGSMVLEDFGTDEQKAKFGHLRLAIGLTEPGAGSDPGNMASTWRYDAATDEYVLNGEKVFISAINKLDGAVTLLRGVPDEQGRRVFSSFIITKDMKGFHEMQQFQKLGMHQFDIAGFTMDDIRVPAINRLEADFGRTMSRFNHNRPLVAAGALGLCRSMLDFTKAKLAEGGIEVDYARGVKARSAAEDKIIRMEALWEAAWGTVMEVKWKQTQLGTTSLGYRTEASMAKAIGGKAARQITQGCLELLGPEGLSEDYLAEKWFRDARIADIYEGAGEIQRILVARDVLGYKKGELN
ncbi:acyl-CoA dehydrogenase family protein [Phenylobacterium sp.]|uniref:acyl-CoA dehydrogenase family protein n=1 Tax=Phenylobacterium sp. TaxID=1871053 RepID=UPI002736778C|nr:acyl-CoA dehydrogenase family protein [Phenylobacterium sp.]MDP3661010.1 acyl-CoA dehydrogenase family protein [Phenylobacterium sp.]